jgi:hypothetical protein
MDSTDFGPRRANTTLFDRPALRSSWFVATKRATLPVSLMVCIVPVIVALPMRMLQAEIELGKCSKALYSKCRALISR